jgi:hypothetical protein
MSDTPRTDDQIGYDGSTMTLIRIEFTKQLERELTAANDRIKRLEEAGDKLSDCADQIGWTSCESPQWIKKAENAVKDWRKAKEAKPCIKQLKTKSCIYCMKVECECSDFDVSADMGAKG